MYRHLLPLALLALLGSCSSGTTDTSDTTDETDTDTDSDADTDTDTDADDDADTDADTDVVANFHLVDLWTTAPVQGVALTSPVDSGVTDEGGTGSLLVPGTGPYAIDAVAAKLYRTYHFEMKGGGAGYDVAYMLTSDSTLDALGTVFGLKIDPAKSMLFMSFLTGKGSDLYQLAEVSTTIDLAYDLAVVPNSSMKAGFSVGNTTLNGSYATVAFVNVDPGTAHLSVDTPGSESCASQAGGFAPGTVDLVGGESFAVLVICN
jgi:hypothetical protein